MKMELSRTLVILLFNVVWYSAKVTAHRFAFLIGGLSNAEGPSESYEIRFYDLETGSSLNVFEYKISSGKFERNRMSALDVDNGSILPDEGFIFRLQTTSKNAVFFEAIYVNGVRITSSPDGQTTSNFWMENLKCTSYQGYPCFGSTRYFYYRKPSDHIRLHIGGQTCTESDSHSYDFVRFQTHTGSDVSKSAYWGGTKGGSIHDGVFFARDYPEVITVCNQGSDGYRLCDLTVNSFDVNPQNFPVWLDNDNCFSWTIYKPPPTTSPTVEPTMRPSVKPTSAPSRSPTSHPSLPPTAIPTKPPSMGPTQNPTTNPTVQPTPAPTLNISPTSSAPMTTMSPSLSTGGTATPSTFPTVAPTDFPSLNSDALFINSPQGRDISWPQGSEQVRLCT